MPSDSSFSTRLNFRIGLMLSEVGNVLVALSLLFCQIEGRVVGLSMSERLLLEMSRMPQEDPGGGTYPVVPISASGLQDEQSLWNRTT